MLSLSAFLALLPAAAAGGTVVTNMTDLLPCIGFSGRADVDFAFEAPVVWGTTPSTRAFSVKLADGYLQLTDDALWPRAFLHDGDVVAVRGRTANFLGKVERVFVLASCLSIEVVRHVAPDPPLDATVDDILAGRYQFRPVRIRGTVRDVFADEIDHRYLHVILSAGARSIGLAMHAVDCDPAALVKLIGADVRVTGCYSPTFSGFRHAFSLELTVRSMDEIEVVSPPPADPFAVPPLESIAGGEPSQIMNLGRHSARGAVIAVWERSSFALRTDAGAVVNVSLAGGPPPACGDVVAVAGLPVTDLYRLNLRRAVWRAVPDQPRRAPAPAAPTAAAALFTDGKGHDEINPAFHGKAITLRGTVVGVPSAGLHDGIVRLRCGDFTVAVDMGATPDALGGLEVGCEAEISGTCIAKTESWYPNEPLPRIRDVILVVRMPSDVRVLVPPPWWTPARFVVLVGALLAALTAFLLWNVLLRRLADKRGRELMHTRLAQEESRLKVKERTRIAVELHDTIAQNLTGVSLEIDSAGHLAGKDTDGMKKHLDMAARTLQSCRNELKNCLWDLRSRALEEVDLGAAIRRTITPLVSDVELAIRFNVLRKELADDTAYVLMRIVRELVQNAVRHGGASQVKIAGSLEDGTLRFSVRDNGCGFDPATRPGVLQGHFGLQGIRERVNSFNGEMQIDSAPGKGTKISISLKL